uniref:Uncharacterized protein n=1 Tax=Hyaloperonospora arabidopsidis (strain Emoy2) TaxID=559515 RepID=M4BYW3_HYAAE
MYGELSCSERSQAHKILLRPGLQTWLRGFDTQSIEDSWNTKSKAFYILWEHATRLNDTESKKTVATEGEDSGVTTDSCGCRP